ncbi:hypothetical protein [Acaryochloris sp. 'Moss Beach']|uniref:hypothetical protein n=1 Tax=Acaryochloris sp. 'Moss Beach' TaxID=2740837 RepID=UPI001F354CD2|nr:hypothetical protein [Acaryochloris sp. 'Moss Beach']
MSEQAVFPHHDLTKEAAVLKKQLAIALKFHHSKTIEKLPKEIAMQVMGGGLGILPPRSSKRSDL